MSRHGRRSSNAASVLSDALGALQLGMGLSDSSGSIQSFESNNNDARDNNGAVSLEIGSPASRSPPFRVENPDVGAGSPGGSEPPTARSGQRRFGFGEGKDITDQPASAGASETPEAGTSGQLAAESAHSQASDVSDVMKKFRNLQSTRALGSGDRPSTARPSASKNRRASAPNTSAAMKALAMARARPSTARASSVDMEAVAASRSSVAGARGRAPF